MLLQQILTVSLPTSAEYLLLPSPRRRHLVDHLRWSEDAAPCGLGIHVAQKKHETRIMIHVPEVAQLMKQHCKAGTLGQEVRLWVALRRILADTKPDGNAATHLFHHHRTTWTPCTDNMAFPPCDSNLLLLTMLLKEEVIPESE